MSRFLAGYLTCFYTISRKSQDCIRNQKITSSSGYNEQCKRNRNLLKYKIMQAINTRGKHRARREETEQPLVSTWCLFL